MRVESEGIHTCRYRLEHPSSTPGKTSSLSTSCLLIPLGLDRCRQDTLKLLKSKDLAAEDLEGIHCIIPSLYLLRCLLGSSRLEVNVSKFLWAALVPSKKKKTKKRTKQPQRNSC